MKNLEIKTLEHKGVKVTMKIDFDAGTASLVEYNQNSQTPQYIPKNWVFSKRGLEYMAGWDSILDALKLAVKECKKELELDLAEKSRFKGELVEKVIKETFKKF